MLLFAGVVWAADPIGVPATVPPVVPPADANKIDLADVNREIGVLIGPDDAAAGDLVKKIQAQPGNYTPPALIFMADRLFKWGDKENAYFWFCFGRLRFLYDAERCADVTARKAFGEMMNSVKPDLRHYPTTMKPDDIVPFAKRVLHLDSVTPYAYDQHWINLQGTRAFSAETTALSVPESDWEGIHRKVCNDYLAGAEGMAEELRNKAAAE